MSKKGNDRIEKKTEADTETSLVRRAASGDRKAFTRLVEEYKKPVYFFAFRMTGNHADADDIAQSTFLRAFQNLSGFEPGTNLRSWLLSIAANAGTDLYRRKGVRKEVEMPSGPSAPASNTQAPDKAAIAKENGELVWQALAGLPADQRAVLVLHAMEGVTLAEISRDMKWPEGTVRWRYMQAKMKMKEKLKSTPLDFELGAEEDGDEKDA